MARQNKSITSFDQVAAEEVENTTKNTIENTTKNETKNEIIKNSKLDDLLSGKKDKKNIPTMVHLEPEVAKALDRISGVKRGRSGKKSQIVNEVLKEVFRSRGLMD